MKKKILISTGGTGGHVIPATIFYDHLKDDCDVILTTDKRGVKFLKKDHYNQKIINTPKLSKNLFLFPLVILKILFLIIQNLFFFKKKKIEILISTGGYMSLPLCIAAKILGTRIILFEPNMVLGRTNKFFLKISNKIIFYSNLIKNFPNKYQNKMILIEKLLRKEFYSANIIETKVIKDKIKLLIIGGSQGAKLFDTILQNTLIQLSNRYKIKVYQQTNNQNYQGLKNFFIKNDIENYLFDFDEKIIELITNVDLCITRAGASTLSELTFLNIPYLAIPLPTAKDNHQFENAKFYENKNCCWLINQKDINHENLLNKLLDIIQNKEDYQLKKNNMKKFSYQNSWNKINQKLMDVINEN